MDAVLLDFRKAFDEVSNQRFSIKRDHYGILGDILQWIQSCITNISQQVLVEGHTSTPEPVTSGVSQGTALGALLFLIYINGLPLKNSSTTHLFADDSLLYRRIKSPKTLKNYRRTSFKTNKMIGHQDNKDALSHQHHIHHSWPRSDCC